MQAQFKETEIGKIPEDWDVRPIRALVSINESTIKKTYPYTEIDYFDTSSVEKGQILGCERLALENAPSRAKRIVQDNDILISTVRPNLKHFAFIKHATSNMVASTGFAVITAKKIVPGFLYYYLSTDRFTDYLTAIADAHTSTYPSFNPDVIENSYIPLPDEAEQENIAKILSGFDARIELNQQMNKTLEEIGQALFKRWFVDFEFIHSSDCRVDELGKHVEFIKGKKPNKISEAYLTGYRPQILIENLNGKEPLYANKDGMTIVGMDEPIMVMDGASSGRVEIGHGGILGSTLAKVIATSDWISNLFLYYFLKSKESEINQNTTGTSIPHADKGRIKKFQCILPSMDILESFNKIARIILNKIIVNKKEIKILSQIRDSLLPRLMSGRIRVKL